MDNYAKESSSKPAYVTPQQNQQQTLSLRYVTLISAVAATGGFLFGFDTGVINGTVTALQTTFQSSTLGTGFSVASMLLGCSIGAFSAGNLANRYGRKAIMLFTSILFLLSALGSGWAGSATEFIIYRLLGGIAVGAASVIVPTYISEIAPAHYRGRLASLQQLGIVIGIFIAFLSNYTIAQIAGGAQGIFLFEIPAWRWMFWVETLPALLFLIGSIIVPESPRYLMSIHKEERAAAVFAKLHAENIQEKLKSIRETLSADHRPKLIDVYDKKRLFHPIVWAGIMLAAFQQLVGINVIFYYGATLWQAAGFGEQESLQINIISGIVNITCTLVAISLIDKIGRKPLLMIGSVGMAITLSIMCIVFYNAELTPSGTLQLSTHGSIIALIAANLYIFSFGVSWGPIVWVMLGEMFSNQMRGAATSVSTSLHWLVNFAVTMTFPILLVEIGLDGAYGIYTVFAILSIFFVKRFLQETKDKTLEQM